MKRHYTSLLTAATTAMLLSACAGSSDKYPSLAIRDVERAQGQFTPVSSEPVAPIRPIASTEDLDALVARAVEADKKFSRSRIDAMILIGLGRDLTIDNNRRQDALVALADLMTIRSETAVALADLDRLTAEAATTFAPLDEIDAARIKIEALKAGQDGTIAGLSETLMR
uniref:hypothetical protein n=1 Tax=uncultured Erythrobacter sp. TaxID=263913 RepID=UPI0026040B51|nr:hypothetical protein [uncultured Erythrobacter sp.]